jgi:hypothetical protein
MLTKKIAIVMAVITAPIIGLQSCYKVATVVPDNKVEVTEPVNFSKDIVPILDSKCNISGCHNAGGTKPDLSADKAFSSLDNGGYININDPENSDIYLWLTGKKGSVMPPGGPNNPDNLNELIKAWVKQGAQNN